MSKVYFTSKISSDSLVKIYDCLDRDLLGRVAVKISTGEPGGHNFLNPYLIKDLISNLRGTIVECCTAYDGKRNFSLEHWQVIKDHGFYDIAPCDIMDEDGEVVLPILGGKHLDGVNYVGSHIKKYDKMIVLSHFKGHVMAGFGGALKNLSIGIASRSGKAWIHSAGKTKNANECWGIDVEQNDFLESMAEACKSVVDYFKPENIVYINILNNISIDCDCDANPCAALIQDIGIMASTDPVALDKCCYDTIMNKTCKEANSLKERMLSKNAKHILDESYKIGLGSLEYEIINIDKGE